MSTYVFCFLINLLTLVCLTGYTCVIPVDEPFLYTGGGQIEPIQAKHLAPNVL